MAWLLMGATGSLGLAFQDVMRRRGVAVVTTARSHVDAPADLADLGALEAVLSHVDPVGVINCAAMVDLRDCAGDPAGAYAINARPLTALAAWSQRTGRPLVHISTDQFFHGSPPRARHDENASVTLASDYAHTKFAGEAFALTSPHALVVRTNMAASRPGRGKVSIAAWAFDVFRHKKPLTLFNDYFCSTIDADTLAEAVLDLIGLHVTGRINVAASEVFTKEEFIRALAHEARIALDWAQVGSAASLAPPRATNVGLDVTKAEGLLSRRLPNLAEVAAVFVQRHLEESA